MAGDKELYVAAEACGETNIKAKEDLSKQAIATAHREQAVAEREQLPGCRSLQSPLKDSFRHQSPHGGLC
jgi:hypothetical protein